MRVSQNALKSILQNNVGEVKFIRRRPKADAPPYRRMLCTNSASLLNSNKGIMTLRYTPPKTSPKYNPGPKNLVLTWDIFMQDYRTINADNCQLISIIPANDQFWEYFSEKLIQMSSQEKMEFMKV
jgi:hypothetical protein